MDLVHKDDKHFIRISKKEWNDVENALYVGYPHIN